MSRASIGNTFNFFVLMNSILTHLKMLTLHSNVYGIQISQIISLLCSESCSSFPFISGQTESVPIMPYLVCIRPRPSSSCLISSQALSTPSFFTLLQMNCTCSSLNFYFGAFALTPGILAAKANHLLHNFVQMSLC